MAKSYRRPWASAILAGICLLVATSASAQVQFGTIFGRVVDSTGAVLPGVSVTIESPALIQPQTATTTETGAFRFPNVPIGVYTVTFELPGFGRLVRDKVQIQAGFNAEINGQLSVSTVQETVTVSGESPIVDTKSTTLGTSFGKELVEAIPSARDPWVILEQTPAGNPLKNVSEYERGSGAPSASRTSKSASSAS